MNAIYVLNQNFQLEGIIDEYVSTIWRPAYSEIGDFEIYLGTTGSALELLKPGRYVVRYGDISMINGAITYRKVMIVKNIQINTHSEDGDFLTVTGRELKYLLHQRIVWRQTNLTGTPEDAIRRLISENAIEPDNSNRVIPRLTFGTPALLKDTIEKQVTGEYLDEVIVDICNVYDYGWAIDIHDGNLTVEVYKGIDRSYDQTVRPYVVFSDDFENLYNTTYQVLTEHYANTTLIGGEGEGLERIYTTVGADEAGLARYETFTDARDISQNKGNEDEIPMATYLALLSERGLENLASLSITEGFSGEVLNDVIFRYGEDFYLGDIVSVANKYGVQKNVRVISAIESEDEDGVKLLPQFNM